MTDLEKLLAIEAIKRLKSRYFYLLDHRDWERWKSEVWAPDGRLEVPELDAVVEGADTIAAWVAERCEGQSSIHHGHMPDIEILDRDCTEGNWARGIWAMEDILRWPDGQPGPGGFTYLHGHGHYHETYVRGSRGWRIKTSRLTRLHVEHN